MFIIIQRHISSSLVVFCASTSNSAKLRITPAGSCLSFAFWFVLFFLFGCLAALSTFVSTSPNATRFFEVLGVGGGIGESSLVDL